MHRRQGIDEAAFALLWPSLQNESSFRCVSNGERLVVIVLGPASCIDDDDVYLAIHLHQRLDRGLLVVF